MSAEPYYADDLVTLHLGDCLEVMAGIPDGSVDAVVTDPPYGLEFMGREWDAPWRSGINADAGFSAPGFTDGSHRLPRPTFTGSTNPACRNCGGRQRGRRDGTAIWKTCTCESPAFPNVRATEMRAFQDWCESWAVECLRVLKPGGHLLAFGGTRTWHRLTCAIEDAGFEVRDSIAWLYGSGFPKSLDVSKAIDKAGGNPLAFREFARAFAAAVAASPLTFADVDRHLGIKASSCFWVREDYRGGLPPRHHWENVRDLLSLPAELEALYEAAERETVAMGFRIRRESTVQIVGLSDGEYDITSAATEHAARWEGWGTALKPAHEPIVVARKPLAGTVAQNVTEHGTGALNIEACRVGTGPRVNNAGGTSSLQRVSRVEQGYRPTVTTSENEASDVAGRWPPNVLLTHSAGCEMTGTRRVRGSRIDKPAAVLPDDRSTYGTGLNGARPPQGIGDADGVETVETWDCAPGCPVAELDRQSGVLTSGVNHARRNSDKFGDSYGDFAGQTETPRRGAESGGASRFFPVFRWQAKAPTSERPRLADGTAWPTVKPLDLMRWLVRLVTPPGGRVLDPFGGSGTTAGACVIEGFRCVLIEKDPVAAELIMTRLRKPIQPDLFGGAA